MGKVICVGLGPGEPDLMSVKGDRIIRSASIIAYFRKAGRPGQARQIVEGMLRDNVVEYAMEYPVTTELPVNSPQYKTILRDFYDHWAKELETLSKEHEIVVLCEGDPFFYGSYMHLYTRLQGKVEQEVIPGITGMSGCWHATGQPITWGDDVLTVLMGTMGEDELTAFMEKTDAMAVMKTGRNLPKIKRALERSGRLTDAWLVVSGTMKNERVCKLTDMLENDCPYFSIVLVHGQGRRP